MNKNKKANEIKNPTSHSLTKMKEDWPNDLLLDANNQLILVNKWTVDKTLEWLNKHVPQV